MEIKDISKKLSNLLNIKLPKDKTKGKTTIISIFVMMILVSIIPTIFIFSIKNNPISCAESEDSEPSSAIIEDELNSSCIDSESESPSSEEVISENESTVPKTIVPTVSNINIETGKSKSVNSVLSLDQPNDKYIFESSNNNIASVDSSGNIKGISNGDCQIIVYTVDKKDVQAYINVSVYTPIKPTYINGILLVNKKYPLPKDYAPGLNSEALSAFNKMKADAAASGLNLYLSSGYRSYSEQSSIYSNFVRIYGKERADKFSAVPGHSEHQTGLAIDLNSIDDSFKNTPECSWVEQNCYKYGFIIRYQQGKEHLTGYQYEPWHIRYVGIDHAKNIYNSGKCLEEYLGLV